MNGYFPQYGRPFAPMTIPGRVVRTEGEITPNEVPMDGSVSLFPAADYSCITAKSWQPDGTIATVRYVPEAVPEEDPLAPIVARLEAIEKRLDAPKRTARRKDSDGE